jgi:hypothetical protein
VTTSDRRAMVALVLIASLALALAGVLISLHRHDEHSQQDLTQTRSYRAGVAAFDKFMNRAGMGSSPQAYCSKALRLSRFSFPGYSTRVAMSGCLARENATDQ